ncbi:hypothetical protein DFH29DRAFT_758173, partial [Suillus ampliporus]
NPERDKQAPDVIHPPSTDHGTLPFLKRSFTDSHTCIEDGGLAHQTTDHELPAPTELARLEEGVVRELHWYCEAEWAHMPEGSCRFTVLDGEG